MTKEEIVKTLKSRVIITIIVACLAAGGPVSASTPMLWEQSSQRDFQSGQTINISISTDGRLSLARSFDVMYETSEPLIWCLAADSKGNIYAGSGNEGKLFKVDPTGKGSVFFDAEELEVQSLAVDAADNIFVATFPDGKIYKLTPDGKSSVFFAPKERYIWTLALDRAGNLYAGTGERGIIYKIDRSGNGQVLVDTEETHIVSLAVDPAGTVIAGTDPNGRVYRVSTTGTLSVLYDSPLREMHALLLDNDGAVYASAIDVQRRREVGPRPEEQTVTVSEAPAGVAETGSIGTIEVTAEGSVDSAAARRQRSGGGGIVYQIAPDGVVREWWRSREDACFALAFDERGTLLVGTGPAGTLYTVRGRGQNSTLAKVQDSQLTAFARTPTGQVYVASSNLGNLYRLGPGHAQEGTFESTVKDTRGTSSWGMISWRGTSPSGTTVRLYTRTGNTDTPDNTWSAWSGPSTNPDGEPVTSPKAQYIQWKASLTSKSAATPVVESVALAYLTQNIAPTVESVTVYSPGVYVGESGGVEATTDDFPPKIAEQLGTRQSGNTNRRQNYGVPVYRKGMRTIAVDADDENDDELTYTVYYRGAEEKEWRLLRDKLNRPTCSWDSETLPDGLYTVKVVASDAPSNPSSLALTAELVSELFRIDNTPPVVKDLASKVVERRTMVTFTAQDAASPIYRVEYAIDAGEWFIVYPQDGVCDSTTETFAATVGTLAAGEHTIAVRVKDGANNIGTGKTVIQVP